MIGIKNGERVQATKDGQNLERGAACLGKNVVDGHSCERWRTDELRGRPIWGRDPMEAPGDLQAGQSRSGREDDAQVP